MLFHWSLIAFKLKVLDICVFVLDDLATSTLVNKTIHLYTVPGFFNKRPDIYQEGILKTGSSFFIIRNYKVFKVPVFYVFVTDDLLILSVLRVKGVFVDQQEVSAAQQASVAV